MRAIHTATSVLLLGGCDKPLLSSDPLSSHNSNAVFKRKLFIVEKSLEELKKEARLALDHGLEIMVVVMIPVFASGGSAPRKLKGRHLE